MKYWLYFQVQLTGVWIPCNQRFETKEDGKLFIKEIKKGNTRYKQEAKYKIGK